MKLTEAIGQRLKGLLEERIINLKQKAAFRVLP